MKRVAGILMWLVLVFSLPVWGQDEEEKPETKEELQVIVEEKKIVTPTKQTDETVYTGSEITKKGLETQGTKAKVSVYEAVDILPGIVAESTDPYGLAAEQNQIRTRGVRGYLGAMTVEGVPNYGGNPMGPRDYLYDMENMESIAVYKGAVPGDLGIGVGARGGAIELRPRWPEKDFGVDFGQAFAENEYSRSFIRLDSGRLPGINTGLAASYSYSRSDKWKGPGEIGPRNNTAFMLSQPLRGQDVIRLWYNYNNLEQHLYRSLTYDEVEDLSDNYDNDYNDDRTGDKDEDIYYYDYNRGEYTNHDVLAVIPITLSDSLRLTFKPYYSEEYAEILQGVSSMGGSIQERERDIDRYGVIAQLDWKLSWMTSSIGYFYESSDMAINNKFYDPVTYDFKGYGMYMESDDRGVVSSPYLKLAGSIDNFDWQAGVKYFHYTEPESQGYLSPPPDYELEKAEDLVREEKEYEVYLPTVGIGYRMSDSTEFYASYGRNHIRPYAYMPLINLYNRERTKFQNAGITLDDLFDNYDMEISDSYEAGARFRNEWLELSGAIFYSKHDNLLTPVYDSRVDLTYNQYIGEATGYGFEMVSNVYLEDYLTLFLNPTYTILAYDKDLTYEGETFDIKGDQIVDTPEWTVKSGMILSCKHFEFVPRIRFIGERYADVEHEEKIDEYTVADLTLGYTRKNLWALDSLTLSVEINNLLDEEYVSKINSSDSTLAGSSSFHVGAPRTALLAITMRF